MTARARGAGRLTGRVTEAPAGPTRPRPIVLVVLDGFGIGGDPAGDAIAAAPMPTWRGLLARWPHAGSGLGGGGRAAARPDGQLGGRPPQPRAGRPVLQDLPRIDAAIADGTFFERPAFLAACARGARRGVLHIVSLVGPGGVHANDRHLVALAELAAREGVPRSASTRCSTAATRRRRRRSASSPTWRPAGGGPPGRRDRDGRRPLLRDGPRPALGAGRARLRRDRPREAAHARRRDRPRSRRPTPAARPTSSSPRPSSTASTAASATATRSSTPTSAPTAPDSSPMRSPTARRSTASTARRRPAGRRPRDLLVVTMTEYEEGLPVAVAFPPEIARSLAQAFARGRLAPVPRRRDREVRPRHVLLQRRPRGALAGRGPAARPEPAGRDLRPRARDERGRRHGRARRGDRVGRLRLHRRELRQPGHGRPHGRLGGDVRALETIDACLARVVAAIERPSRPTTRRRRARCCRSRPTTATPTRCATRTAAPVTAHSLNPVPIVAGRAAPSPAGRSHDGVLADVAPTLLEFAGLPRWPGMTGRSLLAPEDAEASCASIRRRTTRRSSTREPDPGLRPDHRQHRADRRDPAAGSGHRPVRHVRW